MKKYIPKHTLYCRNCPWRKYITTIILNKSNCEYANECDLECQTSPESSCHIIVYRCEYLGFTDWKQETLLWDGVKECGVSKW